MKTILEITSWLQENENLPSWGINLLKSIGTYSPDAVIRLKPIELAALLEGNITPSASPHEDPWNSADTSINKGLLLRAASEILLQIKAMGFVVSETAAHSSLGQEIKVKVEQELSLFAKPLKEKLLYGVEHPEEAWEVLAAIEADPTYKIAAAKATQAYGYPLCIAFLSGGMVTDATLGYLNWLSREYSTPQMEWDGCELGTIRQALSIEEKLRIHPFIDEVISGPDAVGINFLPLDEKDPELWDSIVWARKTLNPLFPTKVDLYEMGSELISHLDVPFQLSSRWEKIRKAFRSAKQGGKTKDGIRCDIESVKKKDLGNNNESFISDKRSESDYKKLVMSNIEQIAPKRTYQGSGCDIKGVFRRISIQGSGSDVNIILIEGGSIQGSGIDGTIKIPEWSAQPSIQGSGCDVDIQKVTWKYIATEMGLF